LKQDDFISPFLFNFALEYVIRRVQVNQDGLKLNGAHQAHDVTTLGASVHTIKKTTGALAVASKEIGLEVNAHKSKYNVLRSECKTKSQYKD
jgi:hypothetical protein